MPAFKMTKACGKFVEFLWRMTYQWSAQGSLSSFSLYALLMPDAVKCRGLKVTLIPTRTRDLYSIVGLLLCCIISSYCHIEPDTELFHS